MISERINLLFLILPTVVAISFAASTTDEVIRGHLLLSSGEIFEGEISLTKGKNISIFDTTKGKRYRLSLSQIKKISVQIESESIEEKWVFKEDSSDEKIKSGKKYPVRQYSTEITLRSGGKIVGHTVFVIYMRTSAGKKKFILRRKHTGKVGQKLSDLVYVKEIVLGNDASSKDTEGAIFGKIRMKGHPISIKAIQYEKNLLFEGKIDDSSYRITGLTNGTYDLVVETSDSLILWLSDTSSKGRPLNDTDKRSFAKWISSLSDFFDTQKPIYVRGTTKKARALIEKERHGKTSYPGVNLVRRYDIWTFHKLGEEWRIDDRRFICRELVKSAEGISTKKVSADERLGGKVIDSEHKRLRVDLFFDE